MLKWILNRIGKRNKVAEKKRQIFHHNILEKLIRDRSKSSYATTLCIA
jgi:hypothetical protein